jgi:hypothetical protein
MNAARSSPEQPAGSPAKWRFLSRGWKAFFGLSAALAALATIVTSWNTISHLFSGGRAPTPEAKIEADVEPMTLQEYERDRGERAAPTAAVARPVLPRPGTGSSFAVYTAPTGQSAGRFVVVSFEEEAKSEEQKVKEEGEKVKEEAKRDEEDIAREKEKAAAEQKSAEAHEQEEEKKEQEEQTKEQEDQKRAEETHKQGSAQAKAEQETAKKEAEKAHEAVQAKKREVLAKKREVHAVRPSTQRRIERGAPVGRVEEVLSEAGEPQRCRPTCGLKPIVEKALKDKSGNAKAAAGEVHAVVAPNSGERLHLRVILKGLERKEVVLTYVIVQEGNEPPPPGPFEGQVRIRTVTPVGEEEPIVESLWVPVPPPSSQEYHLEIAVSDANKEVGFHPTNAFG